jgi:hypothetical protein
MEVWVVNQAEMVMVVRVVQEEVEVLLTLGQIIVKCLILMPTGTLNTDQKQFTGAIQEDLQGRGDQEVMMGMPMCTRDLEGRMEVTSILLDTLKDLLFILINSIFKWLTLSLL